MASIAIDPVFMKDVVFTVDVDSYEKHVSSVTITPSVSSVSWKGLNPDSTFTNASTPTWTVDIEFAQDWTTTDSLSKYLFNNSGETKTITFQPTNGSGLTFTVDAIIVPGSVGGAVDSYALTTVSLPVQGQPTAV